MAVERGVVLLIQYKEFTSVHDRKIDCASNKERKGETHLEVVVFGGKMENSTD